MELSEYHPFVSARAKAQYLRLYEMRAKTWPVASETLTADTSFGKTFVRVSGPAGARPLVLLPGATRTSLMWASNIEALSRDYRTYAVDNIYDYGRSVYTRDLNSPEDFVSWIDELLTALGLGGRSNLMGLSYGGWLTGQYALRFPDRLDKIVLLAPAATVLPFRPEFVARAVLSSVPHRFPIRKFMSWVFRDLAKKDSGRILLEHAVSDMLVALRCFKPKRLALPTVLTDAELNSIRVPALFLVGENEKIYSARKAVQRLNRVAPHIAAEIIPRAGHDLTFVQAETVNKKILEFLSRP